MRAELPGSNSRLSVIATRTYGVAVQLVSRPGEQEAIALSSVDIGRLCDLAPGSIERGGRKNSVWFECVRDWDSFATDVERTAWLADTLNAFVTVFRPVLAGRLMSLT